MKTGGTSVGGSRPRQPRLDRGPRRRRLRWLCATLLIAAIAAIAVAGRAQDNDWRRQHDEGNRYEGRVGIPVSGSELELLSFVGWREDFLDDVDLKVRFYLPEEMPIRLVARELRVEKQYLMEAKPADWRPGEWNEFGPWPTRAVIDREFISSSNLALLIRERRSVGARLIPAFLYHSRQPSSVYRYELHVRPQERLRRIRYLLGRIDGDELERVDSGEREDSRTEMGPGAAVRIRLKVPDIPEGWMRLSLKGSYKSVSGGPELEFDFYHQPRIGSPP